MKKPLPLALSLWAVVLSLVCLPCLSSGAQFYIAQTAQGGDNGTSPANAHAIDWLNNNWGQVNPGDTVHICGIMTSLLIVSKSGSSGHPITIKFEAGSKLSSPCWDYRGAIQLWTANYIIIDGDNVGIIENTANGDALANHLRSCGIYVYGDNVEVKNLIIRNIYVKVYNSEAAGGSVDAGGILSSNSNNFSAHHNIITMTATAIMHQNSSNTTKSHVSLHHNTTSDCNWSVQATVGGAGTITDIVDIYNNDIIMTDAWTIDTQPNWYHHNGSYCYNGGAVGEAVITNLSYYNNYIHSSTAHSWTASGFIHADYGIQGALKIYNNLLVGDANGGPSPAYITVGAGAIVQAEIINNTIVSGSYRSARGINFDGNTGSTLVLKNNIIIGNATGMQFNYPANYTIASDNNDFYNNTSVATTSSPYAVYTALANWQTYLGGCAGTDNECNSLTSNPALNPDYTVPASSPVKWAGTAAGQLSNTDKAGATWHNPPSMGAYEYITTEVGRMKDEGRNQKQERWIAFPNPIGAALFYQYLQAKENLIVHDLTGTIVDNNVPVRPGVYVVEKRATHAVQKLMVVK